MTPPRAPPSAPMAKPAVRPKRCMKAEIGVAVSMDPMTAKLIGRVAQQWLGASESPASPAMVKIIGICAPRMAWAATSTATLRLARLSERIVSGMVPTGVGGSVPSCKAVTGGCGALPRGAGVAKGGRAGRGHDRGGSSKGRKTWPRARPGLPCGMRAGSRCWRRWARCPCAAGRTGSRRCWRRSWASRSRSPRRGRSGGRLEAAGLVTPQAVAAAGEADLRACGLSRPKLRYAQALAGAGVDWAGLRALPDAAVVGAAGGTARIGRWTPRSMRCSPGPADVLAAGDLALQEGARAAFGLAARPDERALRALAEGWSPGGRLRRARSGPTTGSRRTAKG